MALDQYKLALHALRQNTDSDWQEWRWAHDVDCVVCPGCAFTFDAHHCDCEAGWPHYTCPVCGTHGPIVETP